MLEDAIHSGEMAKNGTPSFPGRVWRVGKCSKIFMKLKITHKRRCQEDKREDKVMGCLVRAGRLWDWIGLTLAGRASVARLLALYDVHDAHDIL